MGKSKKKKKKNKGIREFDLDQFVREIQAKTMLPVVLEHHPGTDCFEAKVYSAAGTLAAVASATVSEAVTGLHYIIHHQRTTDS